MDRSCVSLLSTIRRHWAAGLGNLVSVLQADGDLAVPRGALVAGDGLLAVLLGVGETLDEHGVLVAAGHVVDAVGVVVEV